MRVGDPAWRRDDALRRVSNNLHLELRRVREDKAKYERGLRVTGEFEQQILNDIELIAAVRQELAQAAGQ